jgi:hypothetical protein
VDPEAGAPRPHRLRKEEGFAYCEGSALALPGFIAFRQNGCGPGRLAPPAIPDLTASKLGTKFEEIHSDDELDEVRERYLRQGEKAFASLQEELSAQVFGVTFRRTSRRSWELPFVSVIDCRGEKRFRSYYTKWHELGHLLILTDQMRLTFRRTHFGLEDKDPEEALVDVIAGAFGFLPELVRPLAKGQPSFDGHQQRLPKRLY